MSRAYVCSKTSLYIALARSTETRRKTALTWLRSQHRSLWTNKSSMQTHVTATQTSNNQIRPQHKSLQSVTLILSVRLQPLLLISAYFCHSPCLFPTCRIYHTIINHNRPYCKARGELRCLSPKEFFLSISVTCLSFYSLPPLSSSVEA